ncbi:MAG: hypothetical protein K2Y22_14190 [Candidatus Obscuribacterales bacterium]|nr:hypothetical protein [Candidatus Obscuribacterales bacterium]
MEIEVPTANATTLVTSYLTKLKEFAQLSECRDVTIGDSPVNPTLTNKLDALSDAEFLDLVQGIVDGKVHKIDLNGDELFLFAFTHSQNGRTEFHLTVSGRLHDSQYGRLIPYANALLSTLATQLQTV